MIYLKYLFEDVVQLGGQVATDDMIADGWFQYDGDVPQGTNFKLVDGALQTYTPEVSVLTQIQIYKDYLTNTDHKMYTDYEAKPGEDLADIQAQRKTARDYIRANQPIMPQRTSAVAAANTVSIKRPKTTKPKKI